MAALKPPAVQFTLAADVADAGTFTVAYPTGFSDGHFENAAGNYISLNGKKLRQPEEIGLSFGDTSVTVTNRTGGTLPSGAVGYFQFAVLGNQANIFGKDNINPSLKRVRAVELPGLLIDLGAPVVADADGVSASQSVAAAGSFLLNGALLNVAGTGMVFDVPRNVVAAWTTTSILTITGKDEYGNVVVETSASGTSHTGTKAFKSITSITSSASITSATVGTGDVLGLPVRVGSQYQVLEERESGSPLIKLAENVRVPFVITEAEMDAATSVWVVPGFAGDVVGMTTAVGDTVTTGGTLTVEIGGTAVTGLGVVIADSSSAGDIDTDVGTGAAATFTATQALEIVGDAAFNASGRINGYVNCRRASVLNGTLVTGLAKNTKSTSTTGDVRGTYDPVTACDGSVSFQLLVRLPQPDDLGNPQYDG